MPVLVDDTSPFERYRPGILHRQYHASMNQIYKAGWLGRRVFGRLRWLERLCSSRTRDIVDVERFGLNWRLYRRGNVSDSRLLLRPDAFEPIEIGTVLNRVEPGFVFVDIGANCGFYSLRVARALAGAGRVIAIEPHPEIRRRLEFNVGLNTDCDIRILGCAVGDRNRTAALVEGERNLGETRVANEGSIAVEMKTLLDIVANEKLERIDAIKVDVEGFEDRVLAPFFQDAPESLLPQTIVAERTGSDSWATDWTIDAAGRGYRELDRSPQANVILNRM